MKKTLSLLCIPLWVALMFGVTSATWNNDNFIDNSFWSQNPSDDEIVDALFGSEWDNTAYMDYLCTEAKMNVVKVTNSLPILEENTIYVLDTDAIDLNSSTEISIPNCSAIISKRLLGTVITNSAQIWTSNYTVINVWNKSILDNVKVDWNKRYHNWIVSEWILNNISSYNNTQHWIRAKWKINNVKSYNNSDIWIYINWGVRINNVHSFNNNIWIEIRASYVAVNNSQFNNNKVWVYINGDHNLLNNISSYNNEDYWLNFSTQYHDINIYDSIMFNNWVSFNNVYWTDVTCVWENAFGSFAWTIDNSCKNWSASPSWLTMTNVIDVNWNELLDWKNVLNSDSNRSNFRWNKILWDVSLFSYWKNIKFQAEPYYYINNIITKWWLYYNDRYIWSNVERKEWITYVGTKTAVVLSDDDTVKRYSIYWSNNPLVWREIWIFWPWTDSTNKFSVIWWDLPYATHYTEYSVDDVPPTIKITQPSTEWARTKTVSATATDTNPTNQTVTMFYSITTSTECNSAETEYTLWEDILFESEDDNWKYVCFKAVDIVGNESYLVSNIIEKIDRTPPVLESTILNTEIWYNEDQEENFTFKDEWVWEIDWEATRTCWIREEWINKQCFITPNICDILWNCTETQTFESNKIKLDKTAPIASNITYEWYACGHWSVLVTVYWEDALSWMPENSYSFDVNEWNWTSVNTKTVYEWTNSQVYLLDIAWNSWWIPYVVEWADITPTLTVPSYEYPTKIRTHETFNFWNLVEVFGANWWDCWEAKNLEINAESIECSVWIATLQDNILTVTPPKWSYWTVTCTVTFKNATNDTVEWTISYNYNTYNEYIITLQPWWNVVSTPAILSSIEFWNEWENISFSKLDNWSWISVPANISNIIPLEWFLVNNNNENPVDMLFVYKENPSLSESMIEKNLKLWWNFLWITTVNSPFHNIPWATMSLDFTSYGQTNLKNGVIGNSNFNWNTQSSSVSNLDLWESYWIFVNQENSIYWWVNNRKTYTND